MSNPKEQNIQNIIPKELPFPAIFAPLKKEVKGILKSPHLEHTADYSAQFSQGANMDSELIRRESIKNQALEQDINLKKLTLLYLFLFLLGETIIVFIFSFFQATKFLGFQLEEWSFKLLVAVTIIQITVMIHTAVKHLYPQIINQNKE